MDTKKLLMGTLIGGVIFFFLGYLTYVELLGSFFAEHQSGVAMKDPPGFLFIILANLANGALLSYIFLKWAGIKTAQTGMQAGAVIGLLTGLAWDLILYGTTDMGDLTGALADVIIYTVMSAVAGGAIGWFLGRE